VFVIPNRTYIFLLLLSLAALTAPKAKSQCGPGAHTGVDRTDRLPNGVQITGCGITLRVTALRDDVLRVRASQNGDFSEDASWAVLSGPRASTVEVTAETDGFSTKALRVNFNDTMRLTVTDLSGRVLQQDERPVEYHGASFRVYKTMELRLIWLAGVHGSDLQEHSILSFVERESSFRSVIRQYLEGKL